MESESAATAKLRLRPPVGLTFGVACLIAGCLAGTGEILSRTDTARRLLPLQSVGCGQPQLDKKLLLLRDLSERRGPPDCLFLGSSQTYRGIDPAVFEAAFREASGRRITSFNFGLGGLSESGEDLLARMVVTKFRPRLLVIGASAYGLDDDRGVAFAARLQGNPWILYHQGKRTFDGWLVEHSDAFRTYLGVRFWTDPMPRADRVKILGMMRGMTANGYGLTEPGEFRGLDDAMARATAEYAPSPSHLESLVRTLALRSEAEMLVVELPVHESVIHNFRRGRTDYEDGLAAIDRVTRENGVAFWRYPPDRAIPQEGWADFQHLNRVGAAMYSRWLGQRLGGAVRQGSALRAGV